MFLSLTITAEEGVSGRTGKLAGLATETNFVGFASLRFVWTDNTWNMFNFGSMPRLGPSRYLPKASHPISETTLAHTDDMWYGIDKRAKNRASCDRKISHRMDSFPRKNVSGGNNRKGVTAAKGTNQLSS
jgi:hypothetical protein